MDTEDNVQINITDDGFKFLNNGVEMNKCIQCGSPTFTVETPILCLFCQLQNIDNDE